MKTPKMKKLHSIFADHIINFIETKRQQGYPFINEAGVLFKFDRYLDVTDYQGLLTEELALAFIALKPGRSKDACAQRYRVIKQFSVYLSLKRFDAPPLLKWRKARDKSLRSPLTDHISNFINMKRQTGCRFINEAVILVGFDRYLNQIGFRGVMTHELALSFAALNPEVSTKQSIKRYRVIQQFSVYLSHITPDAVPVPLPLPGRKKLLDKTFRSNLAEHLTNFIEMRRRLGYRAESLARILLHFDRYLCAKSHTGLLTQELALNFAASVPGLSDNECARKYQIVRQFSEYLAAFIPETPRLRPDVLKHFKVRSHAHIYTDEEMTRLMNGAQHVSLTDVVRNVTIHAIIGLVASTGLRISEVEKLDRNDVDLQTGMLTIRCGKFRKDRLVPLHQTTLRVLRDYAPLRDARFQSPDTPAFFINQWGTRFNKSTIRQVFRAIISRSGLKSTTGYGPRFHDLRHTFAVRRLVTWYREGKDVQAMLPLLATYMGHVDYKSTAYYLTATSELLGLAAERYEAFIRKEVKL